MVLEQFSNLRLSVVMPVYNERSTIREIIDRVAAVPVPKELIIVDDGSTDGTRDVLRELQGQRAECNWLQVHFQDRNRGKGAAIRTGIQLATGSYVIIQDADLEYDPQDYIRLLQACLEHDADVVYGSRFAAASQRRVLSFWHALVNEFLTQLSNMFTDLNLTDMETCYKLFRRSLIQDIVLEEDRFGFEPEVTAKIARRGLRIYEVSISYAGRSYAEGKKITWKDGLQAVKCIVRYGLRSRRERARRSGRGVMRAV
ncbi:MAG TPA: glycosyltransferase family 2 protein [Ktedonobacteraceae bacterium]|nr:glycosyltransferase family 2 protein [Ktedonobacteraceae bacterium]